MWLLETVQTPSSQQSIRWGVRIATLSCAILLASPAKAEGWLFDAEVGLTAGIEGNNPGADSLAWQRARSRLFGGVEMRNDEEDEVGYGFRLYSEFEKQGSLGGEARYARYLGNFGLYGAVGGIVFPRSLLGVSMGARYVLELPKDWGLLIEPSFSAMPLGGDLPEDSVLLWGLLSVGLRLGV